MILKILPPDLFHSGVLMCVLDTDTGRTVIAPHTVLHYGKSPQHNGLCLQQINKINIL